LSVKVSGLDLSMTGTGVTYSAHEGVPRSVLIKPRELRDRRLNEIASRILELVDGSELVLIEGFLNHSHSAGITGMVHGAVRLELIRAGVMYATLPPTSLKKFATGRGGANKTDMAVAAFKRGDVEFRDDNQCDAWWLWVAANEHLAQPVITMPKAQREALDAIQREG
jgi:Holliday junction resolvasome RuvABC endonuclease subunit